VSGLTLRSSADLHRPAALQGAYIVPSARPPGGVRSAQTLDRMATTASSGYSGTPLAKKLGYVASTRAVSIDAPGDYLSMLEPLPAGVSFQRNANLSTDLVHLFILEREELSRALSALRKQLKPEAAVWVSWPKKASKVPTSVTEDVIRQVALPLGFVDIKVCAVNEVWSGLKLVVRKELRSQNAA
jgi:hypothetical protein